MVVPIVMYQYVPMVVVHLHKVPVLNPILVSVKLVGVVLHVQQFNVMYHVSMVYVTQSMYVRVTLVGVMNQQVASHLYVIHHVISLMVHVPHHH